MQNRVPVPRTERPDLVLADTLADTLSREELGFPVPGPVAEANVDE